jgi:DNA-binding protein HU-beta
MNKEDLIERIVKDTGITKDKARIALDSVVEGITQALRKGNRVSLSGFGTFSVALRKPRAGRNPQTGREIRIPSRKVACFSPGPPLSALKPASSPGDPFIKSLLRLSEFY